MTASSDGLLRHIRRLVAGPGTRSASDAVLLERVVEGRDEEAFAALVGRHAGLVLGVCRRVLGNASDAEDVFQATFLVLARKAASVHPRDTLAAYLHGVARRLALKARMSRARRLLHEVPAPAPDRPAPDRNPLDELSARELLEILDEELQRLPDVYQMPILLCCLEGRSQEEAARLLGWTRGSVQGRLERGRARLHARLVRRGITLPAALGGSLLLPPSVPAVPAALLATTVRLATAPGAVAPAVAALADAAVGSVAGAKLSLVALVLAVGGMIAGAGAVLHRVSGARQPEAKQAADPKPEGETWQTRTDRYGDPLPEGAVARLGTVRLHHSNRVKTLAYSPDGKTLVSGGWDHMIRMWDLATGKELRRFQGHTEAVLAVALSANGKLLASGGNGGQLRLWEVATGQELLALPASSVHNSAVFCIALSPDGKTLASGGGGRGGVTLALWDVATGKELRRFGGRTYMIQSVAFSPDGKTLASGSSGPLDSRPGAKGTPEPGGCTVQLWDVQTGRELRTFPEHAGGVAGVAFSPDGKILASGSHDSTIRVWDPRTGERLRTIRVPIGRRSLYPFYTKAEAINYGGVCAIAFSPDGRSVASGDYDGVVHIWDVDTGKEVRALRGHPHEVYALAFSPDGKNLASANFGHVIRVWELATGKQLHPFPGHDGFLVAAAFSPDGRLAATVGDDRTIHLWDPVTGRAIRVLQGPINFTRCIAFSPDSKMLASGDDQGAIHLWDVATGKELRQLQGPEGWTLGLAFSPDGTRLGSVSHTGDTWVYLWDPATGKEVSRIPKGVTALLGDPLVFSPDGKQLATMGAKWVRFWDVATGKELRRVDGRSWFALSPDGSTLVAEAVTGKGFTLRDIATGKELRQFGERDTEPTFERSFALSPDGRTLAAPGKGGAVRLYDLATGKERWRFEGHSEFITSVVFSPDGRRLLTGSWDSSALVWDVSRWSAGHDAKLSAKEFEALWTDLAGGDGARAHRAILALASSPDWAVAFLKDRLRPVETPDPRRLTPLLAALDSTDFAERERAVRELEGLGFVAEPALRRALKGKPSPEMRRRVEWLLERLGGTPTLRAVRGIEALEFIGTAEARLHLHMLAQGAPAARLTQEAKASLQRLATRPTPKP